MNIILVRHAKSHYDFEKYPTDAIRPLSKKGIQRQKQASLTMKHLNLKFDSVWVSPYTRAKQTLDLILESYKITVPIIEVVELVPFGNEEQILLLLKEQYKKTPSSSILVVGHNPVLSSLLELLDSENAIEMRTNEVAYCEMTENTTRLIEYYDRSQLIS